MFKYLMLSIIILSSAQLLYGQEITDNDSFLLQKAQTVVSFFNKQASEKQLSDVAVLSFMNGDYYLTIAAIGNRCIESFVRFKNIDSIPFLLYVSDTGLLCATLFEQQDYWKGMIQFDDMLAQDTSVTYIGSNISHFSYFKNGAIKCAYILPFSSSRNPLKSKFGPLRDRMLSLFNMYAE